jgi:hypothetical protein
MKRAFARQSLIGTGVIAAAALTGWVVAPQAQVRDVIAAIKAGYQPSHQADTSAPAGVAKAAFLTSAPKPVLHPKVDRAASKASVSSARDKLTSLRAPISPDSVNDPFTVSSWLPPAPPPPPPPPPAPAAPPTAPPLPFGFVGTLGGDTTKSQVFLSNGDRLLIASPGDVIEGQYRLEKIAATSVVFTYLPLNEKQVLPIQSEGK